MCRFFGVSRSGCYRWIKSAKDKDDMMCQLIQQAYLGSNQTYGYRRIKIWIKREYDITVNAKRVLRLMNQMHIQSRIRKKKYLPKVKVEQLHSYANVIDRDFTADKPNSKWVTDITYIHTKQAMCYLSVIKDLYDGFIVAYKVGQNLSSSLVTDTLKDALKKEMVTDGLILHSDQGHQYSSHAYFVLTKGYGIIQSMSRKGNCLDNASVESFFGQLKEEAIRTTKLNTVEDAKQLIDAYIHFYNYYRIQLKTKLTPYEKRCQLE
jgi:putative transposase